MFPRSLRLSRQGFENTRGLLRASSPHFSISYGPASTHGGAGIIVPKKAVKSAVRRHLLKRRIRAAALPLSDKAHILVVAAKTGADKLAYKDLEDELSSLFASIINR